MKNKGKPLRTLGIVGSPRRGGNTDILVGKVLEGAKGKGSGTEKIMLTYLNIAACKGCDVCKKTGKCVHNDDMPSLLQKMQNSDIWVLGTPVYFWGPTAQFKAFLDRWHGAYNTGAVEFKGKRIVLVIPYQGKVSGHPRHLIGMLTETIRSFRSELGSIVLAQGVYERGDVKDHDEVIANAIHAGQRAATGRQTA